MEMKTEEIQEIIEASIAAKKKLLAHIDDIKEIANLIIASLKQGGRLYLFGNGGSAADAQHIAAELVGKFEKERRGFPAIAFTTNTSNLTALANDYGYEEVFLRQVEAFVKEGDVCIGLSTSGTSPNVLAALARARALGAITIGFTGLQGRGMKECCDAVLVADSEKTARIQEVHILVGHIICYLVEENIAPPL